MVRAWVTLDYLAVVKKNIQQLRTLRLYFAMVNYIQCVYTRGGWYTGILLYRGIALIPFWYIFAFLSYRKPDTNYTVKILLSHYNVCANVLYTSGGCFSTTRKGSLVVTGRKLAYHK